MTTCPNCSHSNPQGATQCEACFTPLPATTSCPSCGATIQMDAVFCGQCGTNTKAALANEPVVPVTPTPPPAAESALPPTIIAGSVPAPTPIPAAEIPLAQIPVVPVVAPIVQPPVTVEPPLPVTPAQPSLEEPVAPVTLTPATPAAAGTTTPQISSTQLQVQRYQLNHIQSGTIIDIPGLDVVHIGKPNEQVPPDIDVSGFPCSEVVSRVHADIRVDGDSLYLEDIGSANGTYINHNLLPKGNRHLLRPGDRISLGKGDLVTFLFQSL
jgi:ribosomal protein L40E